ncbi:3-ketoacyl-CoA thiolase @ Acetyl-CoA acetyltransferase [Alloactinosynnema sp. L-07]|uniref:acetyl-CoA C-acyltransferase n=1 Tax=Alloactinosynnema sp. L-07 TaxID=1653480 RepID=UPI00065F0618|nr:acetyl-CoA C-acyltransferase [Alloactinosynnema sp. L-07]CRK55800.1 3-ketoacyl-CoA thiolase @ Acetyl-CoA acetyltransferase [Alloactinosynnema sp. L-07]
MNEVYVLDYVRTARGRGTSTGGLHQLSALDLVTGLQRALVERGGFDPGTVEDVVVGCASQVGEQGGNLARTATLLAGWGDHVPGITVNRFCASGIDAVAQVAARVKVGELGLAVAGGVESVSRVPMFSDRAPLWIDAEVVARTGSVHMGIAADLNATIDGFTRDDLDAFALESHHKAAAAWRADAFDRSLVPLGGLTRDELVRPRTSRTTLAALPPAFAAIGADGQDELALSSRAWPDRIEHRHTVATSPATADGAALLLIGDARAARRLGMTPRARLVSSAVVAHDPVTMLTAGQAAMSAAMRRASVLPGEVAVFQFAEAFAALCLRLRRDFDAGPERLNPSGGTIATGHAFGATGAIMVGDCVEELERRSGRVGVAGVSGAAGLGVAVVVDRAM